MVGTGILCVVGGCIFFAGNFVTKWWHKQYKYDPSHKPYKSLAELLRGDPYFKTGITPNGKS